MSLLDRVHTYLSLLPATIVYRTLLLWLVYFSIGESVCVFTNNKSRRLQAEADCVHSLELQYSCIQVIDTRIKLQHFKQKV